MAHLPLIIDSGDYASRDDFVSLICDHFNMVAPILYGDDHEWDDFFDEVEQLCFPNHLVEITKILTPDKVPDFTYRIIDTIIPIIQ